MPRQSRVSCALGVVLAYVILLSVISVYSIGAYYWMMRVNRGASQAINPIIYPLFSLVNTSTARDPYYLWQVYDLVADGYATQRRGEGRQIRVPIVYIHGNGGHYFCARSLTRFVYESNARERQRALQRFPRHVKERLYLDYYAHHPTNTTRDSNGSRVMAVVPAWLQRRAEEAVVREEMPLLGMELYAVDFHEESNTHSGLITMKEARFLNHSLHVLHERFTRTFADILHYNNSSNNNSEEKEGEDTNASSLLVHNAQRSIAVAQVEMDYLQSVCANPIIGHDAQLCRRARTLLRRYPSVPRLRREVRQVHTRGFWIWAESLGGSVGVLAAMLEPRLCAGIVLVGTPTRYPPLFFDEAEVWLYRIWHDALLRYYPSPPRAHLTQTMTTDNSESNNDEIVGSGRRQDGSVVDLNEVWARAVLPHANVLDLLRQMRDRSSSELAARLENVTIVAINGGALDDVVPSVSNYLLRATARLGQPHVARRAPSYKAVCPAATAYRRDISTEALRGCGVPMDHRGLVYGLQFLQPSADALVQAALLPQSHALFGPEAALPAGLRRDPLFPSVLETLPVGRYARQTEAFRFAATLHETPTGEYELRQHTAVKAEEEESEEEDEEESMRGGRRRRGEEAEDVREGLHDQYREVCSTRSDAFVVHVRALPTMDDLMNDQDSVYNTHEEEEDKEEWVSNSKEDGGGDVQLRLRLLLGVTTVAPEDMYLPELRLLPISATSEDKASAAAHSDTGVVAVPVTRMHLPYIRKNAKPIEGKTLRTVVSFRLARTTSYESRHIPHTAYRARFCFYVPRHIDVAAHTSFVQHDDIDTRSFVAQANEADAARKAALRSLSPLAWLWRWLSSPFALLHIRRYKGYALLRGVDSGMQETGLTIVANTTSTKGSNSDDDTTTSTSAAAMIDPVVLCGSLHAFYLTMRGTSSLGLDEAADGMQYLYGPPDLAQAHKGNDGEEQQKEAEALVYRHTWKPYNVYPWNWNTTYMVYVLTHREARPTVSLHDLEVMAKGNVNLSAGMSSLHAVRAQADDLAQALRRWAEKWPEYWLAYFAGASEMGKLGGAYVLYFFSLYFFFGALERKVFARTSATSNNNKSSDRIHDMGNALQRQTPRLLRALRTLHPLSATLLSAAVLQLVINVWCEHALRICLDPDPPRVLSDAAMTARMDYREKLTLIVLYDLAPHYRECQYSWIWMHDRSWTLFAEKMAGVYLGFCIAAILLVAMMVATTAVRLVTWPLRVCVLRPLLRSLPRLGALVLFFFWAAPTLLWAVVMPWLPLCYVYCVSSGLAHAVLALLPRRPPAYAPWALWWAGFFVCTASLIPAHFEGIVLTVRNQLTMKGIHYEAFWDSERYLLTPRQKIFYAWVQAGLAVLYITVFLYTQQASERTRGRRKNKEKQPQRQQEVREKKVAVVVRASRAARGKRSSQEEKQQQEEEEECAVGYTMGDLNKRYPRWSVLTALCHNVLLVMSLRGGLVAMRRPMEGPVVLGGAIYVYLYLVCFLLRTW